MVFLFVQSMYDAATRTIYVCGKNALPSKKVRESIKLESEHTNQILEFTRCDNHPFNNRRVYYYNSDLDVYATV